MRTYSEAGGTVRRAVCVCVCVGARGKQAQQTGDTLENTEVV